jgi:GNAT superfamily N-acetyltransferase
VSGTGAAGSPLVLRLARQIDVPEMHRIRLAVTENRLSDHGRVTEQSYRRYIAAESAWVAEVDGAVAGFAALDRAEWTLWALFVAPEHEGRGIGRALHRRLIEDGRQRGAGALRLTTEAGSRAARFYLAAGWRLVATDANGELRLEIELAGPV